VLALLGVFVAYQAQPGQSAPVSGNVAAYSTRTLAPGDGLADGSGTLIPKASASGAKKAKSTKTDPKSASRPAARAASAHPSDSAAKSDVPRPDASEGAAPSPSPSASSTASLKADVQKDIASGNYLLAVGQYLVENGYSDAAAAGVASCVDGESGGNPESVGSGGGGLIGWTPISSAAPNANIITGNAAQDMTAQLADLLYYNSTEIGQSLVTQLDGISDPVSAADFYSQNFEKPAVTDSDVVPSVAEQIYSELTS
jgi:hypothetical protein